MSQAYTGVQTRFLRPDERLMTSEVMEMPLVIEPQESAALPYLKQFLSSHSPQILNDIAQYGAVLLRGFDVKSEQDFESTVLSIEGFNGISEAFMSEQGRVPVGDLKYVLHTNAVYKTGGTLYLGGFHSENYYSPDVPAYICFFCQKPSDLGGETGLVHMERVYRHLDESLKKKLEQGPFFVSKWLLTEVAERYQVAPQVIEELCKAHDLPVVGEGKNKFILMYKPSIFDHPQTLTKALQINLFELPTLNTEMRKVFEKDYRERTWFWHRFVWNMPKSIFKALENIYIFFASLFYSPRESWQILKNKWRTKRAEKKLVESSEFSMQKVGSCFEDQDVKKLAQLIRNYYSSCLWQPGDVLLVDNLQVAHAGMPGAGPRLIRALIGNPLEMKYSDKQSGSLDCKQRRAQTLGASVQSSHSIQ